MSEEDKKKPDAVRARLQEAFAVSKSQAYALFTLRTLQVDGSPDAYVADLLRLLALSGHTHGGDDPSKDPVVIEQFISGLPVAFARQLRLSSAGQEMTIDGCVERVRALHLTETPKRGEQVDAVAATVSSGRQGGQDFGGPPTHAKSRCFHCHELGHLWRDCPQRVSKSRGRQELRWTEQSTTSSAGAVRCFFCDAKGHVKSECPDRKEWLASKNSATAAVAEKAAHCLCTTSSSACGDLPRIFTNVQPGGDEEQWERCRAVVDTCSVRTLIAAEFALRLGVDIKMGAGDLVALDGNVIGVKGMAKLEVQ